MDTNTKLTEKVALLAAINPLSQGVGSAVSGWVSVRDYHRFAAEVITGVLGAAATLDAKFQQATDAAGTGAKDIAGAAIVQIVKATGDNKVAFIEADVNALDANGGFAFVQLSCTVAAAASLIAANVFGVNPRYLPPAQAAAVVQVVG